MKKNKKHSFRSISIKKLAFLIAGLTTACVLFCTGLAHAQAIPQSGSVYNLICKTSGLALDNGGSTSNGTIVKQWTPVAGETNQEWKLVDVGGGYDNLICKTSGLALDNDNGTTNGNPVIQWPQGTGNPNQEWKLVSVGGGYYNLICKTGGLALDNRGSTSIGTAVQQWTPVAGETNQEWLFMLVSSGGSLTGASGDGFHSLAMPSAQTGTFTTTFDATPSTSPENAVLGLSKGAATAYTSMSCIARFNPTGQIDAYNGTGYAAAATINYSAKVSYHFRMVVNVTTHTYSVYVTPAGGSELTVGLNYAFRTTQASLDTWNLDLNATPSGCTLIASNLSIASGSVTTHTITASAGANGSISPSGTITVNSGSSQSFTITPSAGSTISSVVVDGANVGAVSTYTFTNVLANHTISATFGTTTTHTITASAGANGSISPSGAVNVKAGSSQSFTITPSAGSTISSVVVDGANVGAVSTYTFTNVLANHTISATFTNSGGGLNPNVAPGGNFDLSNWEEQEPVASGGGILIIPPSQLVGPNGYQDQYFFTNKTTGAMEFWTPENGAHTANSSFPRSELRELKPGGDWFSTGTHTLTATLVVNDTVQHVSIGQIHIGTGGSPSSTKPLLELFYYSTGDVELLLEATPAGGNGTISPPITNVPIGTKFSYTIKLSGNTITIIVNGVTKTFSMPSSFNAETFYFKAGDYLQTTGSSSTIGAHVSFYALKVVHQ